jgi:uncharacterized membrane protein YkvA (DUF1232 family)
LVRLHWRLLRDPRVSWAAKAVLVAGVVYFVSPYQIIEDVVLPGLGWVGGVVVLLVAGQIFIRLCPPRVVEEHVRLLDAPARDGRG